MELRIIRTDDTLPAHLQECLHYTATAKLAPQWNSVQDLLIQGGKLKKKNSNFFFMLSGLDFGQMRPKS